VPVGLHCHFRTVTAHLPQRRRHPLHQTDSSTLGCRSVTSTSTTKLDSPPPRQSTLRILRPRSNTDTLRARSVSVRISQARGEEGEQGHRFGSPFKMLVPKGYSWKATKARLPPSRQIIHTIRNPRFLLPLTLFVALVLLWRSLGSAAGDVQRYVDCMPNRAG
jgi:hypothetical protein